MKNLHVSRSHAAFLAVGILLGCLLLLGVQHQHEEKMKLKHLIAVVLIGFGLHGAVPKAQAQSVVFTDNFNRSNTTPTATPGAIGNNWIDVTGNYWDISSNTLTAPVTSGANSSAFRPYTETILNTKVTVTFKVVTQNEAVRLAARIQSNATHDLYYLEVDMQGNSTQAGIGYKNVVSGTETFMGNGSNGAYFTRPAVGDIVQIDFSASGTSPTTLTGTVTDLGPNGTGSTVLSTGSTGGSSVATLQAAGSTGIYAANQASGTAPISINSFTATNLSGVAPGTYASFAANDSHVAWSPGVVYFDSSSYAHVDQNATYFKTGFTGTSFGAIVDISSYHTNSIAAAGWGQWIKSVDGGAPVPVVIPDPGSSVSTATVTFASGLAAGSHTIECWYDAHDDTDSYTPKDVQTVQVFLTDTGSTLAAPSGAIAVLPKSMMVMGDSITHGFQCTDPTGSGDTTVNYPLSIYASLLGRALNCETGIVGFQGQGYTRTYNAWTQTFPQSFPNFDSAHTRVWPTGLTYLALAEGTNDLGNDVTSATQSLIGTARAAVGASTWIIVVVPFAGLHRADLTAAVSAYKAANPADTKVALVDPSLVFTTANAGTFFTVDGTHPPTLGHVQYAAILASLIQQATAPTSVFSSSGQIKRGR